MRDWKAQAKQAELMLTGAAPYDEAGLRQILTGMVGDARDVVLRDERLRRMVARAWRSTARRKNP